MRNAEVEGKGFLARVACGAVIVQPRRVGVVVRVLACASLVAVGVGVASGRAAALAAPNLMLAKIPAPVRPFGTWSLRVSVSGDLPPDTEVELSVSRDRLKDRGAFISSINDFPAPGPNKTKVTTALAKDVAVVVSP